VCERERNKKRDERGWVGRKRDRQRVANERIPRVTRYIARRHIFTAAETKHLKRSSGGGGNVYALLHLRDRSH